MERGMREMTSKTRMMSIEKGIQWERRSAASHLCTTASGIALPTTKIVA